MTFLQLTNAETGIYSAEGWDAVLGGWNVTRDNAVAHAGSWSWLVAGDGQFRGGGWNLPGYTSGRWYLIRFWVRINVLPGSSQVLGLTPGSGNNAMAELQLNTDGTLQGGSAGSFGFPTSKSAALVAGNWHKLEFAGRSDAASSYSWLNGIWRLDGVEFQRHCGRPVKGAFNKMYAGTSGGGVRVNVDDMVLNDDTGSSANYWNDGVKAISTGKTKPSVRSVSAPVTNTVAANNIVVNAPSSITSGDMLTMVVELTNASPGAFTFPTGWAQRLQTFAAGGGGGIVVATKVATGSEPSTYTVSWLNASLGNAVCYSLAGVSSASPIIDGQAAPVQVNNNDSAFMIPALDLTEGDALILQAAGISNASATKALVTPAWWTNATNVADNTNGSALACGFFGQTDGGLTATGLMSATSNITASVPVAAVAFRSAPVSANKFMAVA